MHEVSICTGLVKVVLDEMQQHTLAPGSLRTVTVVAGQLHQLVPDALQFAYELLTRDTPAAGSRLDVRLLPLAATCPSCGWEGAVEPPLFVCTVCGAGITIKGGDELYVEKLETA